MDRLVLAIAAFLVAGCASSPERQADRRHSPCPSRHTLACDVSPRTREIIPDSCSCVRTSDVNTMLRSSAFGMRVRPRIR